MYQITLNIDGMMCAMCESHVNDAVRNAFPVKKVTSSHSRGETVILSETAIPEAELRPVFTKLGYALTAMPAPPMRKRGCFAGTERTPMPSGTRRSSDRRVPLVLFRLEAALHAVHAQDGCLRLCVRDAPGEHVARKLLERHGLKIEKFVVVELLLAEGQAAGEVHPDDLVRVRGRRGRTGRAG